MKFFITGSQHPYASETSYARLLREKGCQVMLWDEKAASPIFGNRNWWQLTRAERVAYDAIKSVRFYFACRNYKPDVLFMPKAENIHSEAVKRVLEDTAARLVIWYPDNPFKADQTSMNLLRDLKRCDRFYIWGKFLIDALRSAGCKQVDYLPFGFDATLHPSLDTLAASSDHSCDICFVGTWDKEREAALKPLADFDVRIWGPMWTENLSGNSPLRKCLQGKGLYGTEMVRAFKSAKVVFNHLRLHNGSAHNNRTMETTGIGGGAMLVRRTVEQSRELFTEGEHLLCFESETELRRQVQTLLDDDDARLAMAARARQRVFSEHLLSFRFDQMLQDLS